MSLGERRAPTRSPQAAAAYLRISRDKVGAGLGVNRQLEDCRRWCDQHTWETAEVYCDNDVSAYSGRPRREYLRMLKDIESGRRDGVIAWHNDRLHRSPVELEEFITLVEKTGVAVATVTAGEYDLTTPTGRMQARIVGAVARHESEHKSQRIKRKKQEIAQLGEAPGAPTFGYIRADVTAGIKNRSAIILEEAAIIREMAQRVLAGETLVALVRDLNDRGVKTATGGAFHSGGLKKILISDWVCGYRTNNGARVAKGTWQPILDEVTVKKLRAVLLDPARLSPPRGGRRLLTGLLLCGHCDSPLVGAQREGRRIYRCQRNPGTPNRRSACSRLSIMATELEEDIADRVVAAIKGRRVSSAMKAVRPPRPDEPDKVVHIEAKLKELAELYAADQLTPDEWMAAHAPLLKRLEEAKAENAERLRGEQVVTLANETVSMAGRWDRLSDAQKRVVLEAVVRYVKVGSARRGYRYYDPTRVSIPEDGWNI
jgi:DNA invertase Pin-like site-specific DNA recombinase